MFSVFTTFFSSNRSHFHNYFCIFMYQIWKKIPFSVPTISKKTHVNTIKKCAREQTGQWKESPCISKEIVHYYHHCVVNQGPVLDTSNITYIFQASPHTPPVSFLRYVVSFFGSFRRSIFGCRLRLPRCFLMFLWHMSRSEGTVAVDV